MQVSGFFVYPKPRMIGEALYWRTSGILKYGGSISPIKPSIDGGDSILPRSITLLIVTPNFARHG
jgi:hypothetical protein